MEIPTHRLQKDIQDTNLVAPPRIVTCDLEGTYDNASFVILSNVDGQSFYLTGTLESGETPFIQVTGIFQKADNTLRPNTQLNESALSAMIKDTVAVGRQHGCDQLYFPDFITSTQIGDSTQLLHYDADGYPYIALNSTQVSLNKDQTIIRSIDNRGGENSFNSEISRLGSVTGFDTSELMYVLGKSSLSDFKPVERIEIAETATLLESNLDVVNTKLMGDMLFSVGKDIAPGKITDAITQYIETTKGLPYKYEFATKEFPLQLELSGIKEDGTFDYELYADGFPFGHMYIDFDVTNGQRTLRIHEVQKTRSSSNRRAKGYKRIRERLRSGRDIPEEQEGAEVEAFMVQQLRRALISTGALEQDSPIAVIKPEASKSYAYATSSMAAEMFARLYTDGHLPPELSAVLTKDGAVSTIRDPLLVFFQHIKDIKNTQTTEEQLILLRALYDTMLGPAQPRPAFEEFEQFFNTSSFGEITTFIGSFSPTFKKSFQAYTHLLPDAPSTTHSGFTVYSGLAFDALPDITLQQKKLDDPDKSVPSGQIDVLVPPAQPKSSEVQRSTTDADAATIRRLLAMTEAPSDVPSSEQPAYTPKEYLTLLQSLAKRMAAAGVDQSAIAARIAALQATPDTVTGVARLRFSNLTDPDSPDYDPKLASLDHQAYNAEQNGEATGELALMREAQRLRLALQAAGVTAWASMDLADIPHEIAALRQRLQETEQQRTSYRELLANLAENRPPGVDELLSRQVAALLEGIEQSGVQSFVNAARAVAARMGAAGHTYSNDATANSDHLFRLADKSGTLQELLAQAMKDYSLQAIVAAVELLTRYTPSDQELLNSAQQAAATYENLVRTADEASDPHQQAYEGAVQAQYRTGIYELQTARNIGAQLADGTITPQQALQLLREHGISSQVYHNLRVSGPDTVGSLLEEVGSPVMHSAHNKDADVLPFLVTLLGGGLRVLTGAVGAAAGAYGTRGEAPRDSDEPAQDPASSREDNNPSGQKGRAPRITERVVRALLDLPIRTGREMLSWPTDVVAGLAGLTGAAGRGAANIVSETFAGAAGVTGTTLHGAANAATATLETGFQVAASLATSVGGSIEETDTAPQNLTQSPNPHGQVPHANGEPAATPEGINYDAVAEQMVAQGGRLNGSNTAPWTTAGNVNGQPGLMRYFITTAVDSPDDPEGSKSGIPPQGSTTITMDGSDIPSEPHPHQSPLPIPKDSPPQARTTPPVDQLPDYHHDEQMQPPEPPSPPPPPPRAPRAIHPPTETLEEKMTKLVEQMGIEAAYNSPEGEKIFQQMKDARLLKDLLKEGQADDRSRQWDDFLGRLDADE